MTKVRAQCDDSASTIQLQRGHRSGMVCVNDGQTSLEIGVRMHERRVSATLAIRAASKQPAAQVEMGQGRRTSTTPLMACCMNRIAMSIPKSSPEKRVNLVMYWHSPAPP